MTLLTQVVMGALWAEVFGFSHFGLRLLNILLGAGSLVLAYGVGRELHLTRAAATVTASLLMGFPVFLAVSATFMTDTPFLFLALLALFCLLKSFAAKGHLWFAAGTAVVVAAILLRQTAIAIALGYALTAWIVQPWQRTAWRSALLIGISALTIFSFPVLVEDVLGESLPPYFTQANDGLAAFFADFLAFEFRPIWFAAATMFTGIAYIGLIASPLAVGVLVAPPSSGRHALLARGAIIAGGVIFLVLLGLTGDPFPRGNIWTAPGIGPRHLEPYFVLPPPGAGFHHALAFFAGAGLAALLVELIAVAPRLLATRNDLATRDRVGRALFVLFSAAITYAPYCVYYGAWYDRYMLLPGIGAVLGVMALTEGALFKRRKRRMVMVSIIAWTALAAFEGALSLNEYFTWARARADLVETATNELGIAPEDLDAGFEFANELMMRDAVTGPQRQSLAAPENWPYAIVQGSPPPGATVIATREMPRGDSVRMFTFGQMPHTLHLIERKPQNALDPADTSR